MRVAFDTSVLVAAARSRQGASFALLGMIPSTQFQLALSVGLYMEWQAILVRPENIPPGRNPAEVLAHLRFLAHAAHQQNIHFLWRPFLRDSDDDMVLELALAANCSHIVTLNPKDFAGSDQFGIEVIKPGEFLKLIRGQS